VIGAGGLGKFGEEAREIRVRVDAIGAGGFDQRVQSGACGGASVRIAFWTRLASSGTCR
jgi:hypothetical protein